MRLLYDEKVTKTDVYAYQVNQGGELNIKAGDSSGKEVFITFQNGILVDVEYNLCFGTRNNWHVLNAIANKINELEKIYQESK